MTLSTVHRVNYTCRSCILPPLHPYYWSHPILTSTFFVQQVSSKWQDVLISLGWLDAISLARCLFFSCVFRPSGRKLCLHPDLSAGSELASLCVPTDPNHQGQRCALVLHGHGNGDGRCQRVCCLLWLQIKARAKVGMSGVEREVMWLDVGW